MNNIAADEFAKLNVTPKIEGYHVADHEINFEIKKGLEIRNCRIDGTLNFIHPRGGNILCEDCLINRLTLHGTFNEIRLIRPNISELEFLAGFTAKSIFIVGGESKSIGLVKISQGSIITDVMDIQKINLSTVGISGRIIRNLNCRPQSATSMTVPPS